MNSGGDCALVTQQGSLLKIINNLGNGAKYMTAYQSNVYAIDDNLYVTKYT